MTDPATPPHFEWQPMGRYIEGRMVLIRGADRQLFGFGQDGAWFEVLDGEEIHHADFEPLAWADAPGGAAAWA